MTMTQQDCCVCQEEAEVNQYGVPKWAFQVDYTNDDGDSTSVAICLPCFQDVLVMLGQIMRERTTPLTRSRR